MTGTESLDWIGIEVSEGQGRQAGLSLGTLTIFMPYIKTQQQLGDKGLKQSETEEKAEQRQAAQVACGMWQDDPR